MSICQSGDICEREAVESTTFPGNFVFCIDHQNQLDRCREEMKVEAHRKSAQNKEGVIDKQCVNGCDARPIYGTPYCAECQEAGN